MRRTVHPRRRLGPVNPTVETTSTSRSETRSETTGTSREERVPERSSLMWSRPIPSPWHVCKPDLMNMNLQTVRFAADAMRTHFEEEDLSERQECRALTSNLEGTAVDLMRFEKRRRREDETIEKFLDNLEMLRRRSQPNESNRRMNLAVASKIIDGVKNDELRTMSATHYTLLSTNAPTPKELRLKSKKISFAGASWRSVYHKNN